MPWTTAIEPPPPSQANHHTLSMTVHSFYVFNRRGMCLYHRDWSRTRRAAPSPGEDQKLVFGILLSSGGIAGMLTPDK
jgi:Sybindin-like family